MAMTMEKNLVSVVKSNIISGINDLGDDLIERILIRLPALSFAWAACVSLSWNSMCNRILFSSPKLSSALSLNHSIENAVNEVVDKVLSEPIRPHFALVSVGPCFDLRTTHQLIVRRLGSRIPIITNLSEGIIGRNMLTDEFEEVQWELTGEEDGLDAMLLDENVNQGIMLMVGFLPGLKVHTIPLLFDKKGLRRPLIDEYVTDIRKYTSAVSDSPSPVGIILFADPETDIRPVLQTIEYAFPEDTFVVGDGGSRFLDISEQRNTITGSLNTTCAAVSLVFARDRNKPLWVGETQFQVLLSNGISPVGSTYKTVSVGCDRISTWLSASRETLDEDLDGETMLDDIYDELGDRIQYPALYFQYPGFYIGVTKTRFSVGTEKVKEMQFHKVLRGDEENLFVKWGGIKTGEPFRFYISDSKAALSSVNKVSDKLKLTKRKVFGGIIFSSCGRGESFFGRPCVNSAPFLNNFPGVPFGGTYCATEIGRGNLSLYENGFVHCSQHVFSAVYLVMSYCPQQ